MHRRHRGNLPLRKVLTAAAAASVALLAPAAAVPAGAAETPVVDPALARSPELSETSRLSDRRFVVTGEDGWELGSADGRYPAAGFHTRGEMGGFWTPQLKLLDGIWFGFDGKWIGKGRRTTSGWGYVRTDLPTTDGVAASRTDFVPAGVAGAVVGLSLRSERPRTVVLRMDAHSELMGSYPWGETTPSQTQVNLADTAAIVGKDLVFRDHGTPPASNGESHDWAAAVGSDLAPLNGRTGPDFRGPQDPAVICPASGPDAPAQPDRCDDTQYGNGAGGQMTYRVKLPAGAVRTVWFAVGGSTTGPAAARAELAAALQDPAASLDALVEQRTALNQRSDVTADGDPLVARSVAWSKQMLAASVQRAHDVRLRVVRAGTVYPPPAGTLDSMRWLGAGWPDYSWLFGTDGEYTAFASVAAGQFGPIEDHLRALRDVSQIVNGGTGKIVHEVTPDGAVYFGANADAGNTDESAKFPSAVALVWRWTGDQEFLADLYPASVKAMQWVASIDADGDGWPEGLGNVERPGMGEEKLDNAVYAIRGYADLADLAKATGDDTTAEWAETKVTGLLEKFEDAWWYGGDTHSYADSLADPGDDKVFQRHWIGLTPTDAVLPELTDRPSAPLASAEHGPETLAQHERECFTGDLGLYHTGTGPTSAEGGNVGPSCDSVVSEVPSERNIFTLNSAIAAVSEGNYGRLGEQQQGVYTHGNARSQLDPSLWEMPGAMPEIVPGGDFGANIDRKLTERSMVMQAWGAYGVLWPVVHQWLGVSPDMGRGALSVVPQVPAGQTDVSATDIRVGETWVDVATSHAGRSYVTEVTRDGAVDLTIGATLPVGTTIASATLNGAAVTPDLVRTTRGLEARVQAPAGAGTSTLRIDVAAG